MPTGLVDIPSAHSIELANARHYRFLIILCHSLPSAQAHTKFCRPLLHAHMAMNQKVLISSVTQAISTTQLPSLTKVLGESHLSSFVLERWAQRHIQKRYAVAPICPPEDDLKEQD